MTDKEIVQALRCCAEGECKDCDMHEDKQSCQENLLAKAAEAIERLTAENADLRKEIEWKDMVIALAQRKQAEAEAERDALLEYAKTMQECEMCKNDTFCHLREPMEDDCQHCQRASDCPCQKCEENNCWEWRGLPGAPEG
jgi:hypothetical protein